MEFLLGLPFAIFLLLGCVQRGCNKFLLGPFGVCVVEPVGTILAMRGCAQSLEKKSKIGFSCRKRRSTAMFSRVTPYDISLVTNESGLFPADRVLFFLPRFLFANRFYWYGKVASVFQRA